MNVPLQWLAEYVKLPTSEKELTDKLTMVGHMLDKRTEVEGSPVIDLELRGNRSDLFGMIGMAREVSAAWDTPLTLPTTKPIPSIDSKSNLVTVEANDLVERFLAFRLTVTVKPSPAWMVKRLAQYGIPSINNVVDITNYVLVETGEPMHAYDMSKLAGERLILRRAKKGEKMVTLQGTTLTFSTEDLVIADEKQPQATTIIGGQFSGVTNQTTEILLEAAVYHQANVRRTARRLGVRTEAGNRHEKLLDPNQVPYALERAYQLLTDHANAKPVGNACDVYIKKRKPISITLPLSDITRLTGVTVAEKKIEAYLVRLGFTIQKKTGNTWAIIAPTFRTDIEQSADVVEEIVRLYGYENIPTKTLSGVLPEPNTDPMIVLTEQVRDILVNLQQNEVITSPIIANDLVPVYQQEREFTPVVTLVNAPDPNTATLRPSLLPNLVDYAKRMMGFRQERIALFEIGKTYAKGKKPKYHEEYTVSLLIAGVVTTTAWNAKSRPLTVFDLKGVIEGLLANLGITAETKQAHTHPSLDLEEQGKLTTKQGDLGSFGRIHPAIAKALGVSRDMFLAELSLPALAQASKHAVQPYVIAPVYPPIIEDMSFIVSQETQTGELVAALAKLHPLIASIQLVDVYEQNRAIRVTYVDPKRTLTAADIQPVRQKIIDLALSQFGATLKTT